MAMEPTPPAPPKMSSEPVLESVNAQAVKEHFPSGDGGERQGGGFGEAQGFWLEADKAFVHALKFRVRTRGDRLSRHNRLPHPV